MSAYENKLLSVILRKACKRRGFTLKVAKDKAWIFNAATLVWKGELSEARAWLDAEHPVKRGRPARPKAKRIKAPGARVLPSLDPGDRGIASEDHTPANAQGLVETEVALPAWLDGDAALIALWRSEWRPGGPLASLADARRELRGPCQVCRIVLSDADRASLAAHADTPAEVFVRAALAPRRVQSRTR